MAEYTTNKKLELPKSNERYDVAVANKNNMVIDSELNKLDLKNRNQDAQIDEAITHKNNDNNPHNVTKAQIGLNKVDNTSDVEKPVSNAQRELIGTSIMEHNESDLSHIDIRQLLSNASARLNALADSDDETLDQLSEIVAYIKNNKSLIDGITTSKVNVSDIIDTIELLQANTVSGKLVDALLIKQVFQSVSNGKSLIASAITDKGVKTDATATFNTMAENIMNILTKNKNDRTLISINMTPPAKATYETGDVLDLSGVTVIANYESTEDITNIATYSHTNGQELTQPGTVTISVSYTDGEVTKTAETNIIVTPSLEIVSWAEGTDEQIAAMLDAHYAGEIDIHDYWHVGDERTIHLSEISTGSLSNQYESHVEQNVTMVLMNAGGKTLVNSINGESECAFIVGQKNCLTNDNNVENGVYSSSDDNNGGWENCKRRVWCNNLYYNAFPTTFKNLYKKFNNITANGSDSTTTISEDYFALPSEKEVFGNVKYANEAAELENKRFTYYNTSINRLKKSGDIGDYCSYWLRSPYSGSKEFACYVVQGGTVKYPSAVQQFSRLSFKYGIAPFGCI